MNLCTDVAALLYPIEVAFEYEVYLYNYNRGSWLSIDIYIINDFLG